MIKYPKMWKKNYADFADGVTDAVVEVNAPLIRDVLSEIICSINVRHLAYSGGIDSTILLCIMKHVFTEVFTYTISSRDDHKDVQFARLGSTFYKSNHTEFIVFPNKKDTDKFVGDNAVRQLFELLSDTTNSIVCGDGVDEFMCGYHKHKDCTFETYKYFLGDLLLGHLIPLDSNSGSINVFLPYLDASMISLYRSIPLSEKVDKLNRKKVMVALARLLNVPEEIIGRHKYGFVDAFIQEDKSIFGEVA